MASNAAKSSVLGKILAIFLVLIIISGSSFLAYNLISGSVGGMNISGMKIDTKTSTSDMSKDQPKKNAETTSQDKNDNKASSKDNMDMDKNSTNDNITMKESTENNSSQYSTPVIKAVLQNKEDLEKTLVTLKESVKLMKLDPLGDTTNQQKEANASDTQDQGTNAQDKTTDANGNTTVNIYTSDTPTTSMPNMGTTYDATKMEQLHTGLYKVSVGMQLLEQLKENLTLQLEHASMNITNPSQYYNSQYLTTLQNNNKLSEALNYINEASSLVNINPYISQTGLVYDKDKMGQMHDSIDKLAISVVNLNKINDDFSRQSIELISLSQNSPTMTNMDTNTNSGVNLFSNLNMTTVFNGLVIVFILIFIIAIFGYISRLLKSPKN